MPILPQNLEKEKITQTETKTLIVNSLNIIHIPGSVVELRIPKAGKDGTVSGYFDNFELLAEAALQYSGKAPGVYFSLNPVNQALLARASNKIKTKATATTSDKNILSRRWFPVDVDPVRPAEISSSEEEYKFAHQKADQIARWLMENFGWPEPLAMDSGNGAHRLWRIDEPNDDATRDLIKKCLEILDTFHSDERVCIDRNVYNAGRIWKLPRTMTCKGENTEERPHRQAKILKTPKPFDFVSREQLEALAALLPEPERQQGYNSGEFDIEEWMDKHGLTMFRHKSWQGGILYELETCPFDPEHKRTARVIQMGNGALSFGCFHNSCANYKWKDLRDKLEPGWRESYQNNKQQNAQQEAKIGALTPERRPQIICLADVEPAEVNWLWKPYIPKGKITLLDGDPNVGKTMLALQLAAAITAGYPLPNPGNGKPEVKHFASNVLYLTAEDGLADTLRPRLDDMQADLSRFFALTGSEDKEGKLFRVTLNDLETIEKSLEQHKPALLVVDPIQGYLGAKTDMFRPNEVRPILAGLAALAEKYSCAVLCIRHLTKGGQARAIYRGFGSIDFSAAARSILLAGQDQDNPDKRAIIHIKSNLAKIGPSIGFEITKEGRFYWKGLSELTTASVFQVEQNEDERNALDEAKEFLKNILASGSQPTKDIFAGSEKEKIAQRTLYRAKKSMLVKSFKPPHANGPNDPWYWKLPEWETEI